MTHEEKHRRWLRILRARGWTVKEATEKLGVALQTGYNWNAGKVTISDKRLKQLEALPP